MARRIRKIDATCPKCGHSQPEPAHFIATICRECGETFPRVPVPVAGASAPSRLARLIPEKLSPAQLFKRPPRVVHCYRCGRDHEVSPYAHTTLCPRCNSHIQLENILIESHASRPIDTRGDVLVNADGYLNTASTYCTNAMIQGRISGFLICEKTLTLNARGRCQARIEAQTVIIERDADLEFYFPIRTNELIVRGRANAVIRCSGVVGIRRTGHLVGEVRSRSFQVEKGGVFQGQLTVNAQEISMEQLHSLQQEFPFLSIGKRVGSYNPDYAQS